MTESRERWREVSTRLTELTASLRQHYEQASDDQARDSEGAPGQDASEKDREDAREAAREALQTATEALDRAFSALGQAARDDTVRDEVRATGQSLVSALDATFSELGDRVRAATRRDRTD